MNLSLAWIVSGLPLSLEIGPDPNPARSWARRIRRAPLDHQATDRRNHAGSADCPVDLQCGRRCERADPHIAIVQDGHAIDEVGIKIEAVLVAAAIAFGADALPTTSSKNETSASARIGIVLIHNEIVKRSVTHDLQ